MAPILERFCKFWKDFLRDERGDPKPPPNERPGGHYPRPYHSKAVYDANGKLTGYVERECFIATACSEAQGLPSDCEALNILRDFRDQYIRRLPLGNMLVKMYYFIAPKIVADIDRGADADSVYQDLYQNIVLRSTQLIGEGKCKTTFINALKIGVGLTTKYLLRQAVDIFLRGIHLRKPDRFSRSQAETTFVNS